MEVLEEEVEEVEEEVVEVAQAQDSRSYEISRDRGRSHLGGGAHAGQVGVGAHDDPNTRRRGRRHALLRLPSCMPPGEQGEVQGRCKGGAREMRSACLQAEERRLGRRRRLGDHVEVAHLPLGLGRRLAVPSRRRSAADCVGGPEVGWWGYGELSRCGGGAPGCAGAARAFGATGPRDRPRRPQGGWPFLLLALAARASGPRPGAWREPWPRGGAWWRARLPRGGRGVKQRTVARGGEGGWAADRPWSR